MIEPTKVFEGWQLGFREFFRMIVPGVGFLVLGSPYVSQFLWAALGTDQLDPDLIVFAIIAALLVGLAWFSMQIPKRMGLYRRRVDFLRRLMTSLVDDEDLIDKPAYQFLVDCVIHPSAGIRVHYFASYYYMLMDLALIAYALLTGNIIGLIALTIAAMSSPVDLTDAIFAQIIACPKASLVIPGLLLFGAVCWKSSIHFLDDIMEFSIFIIEKYKEDAQALSQIAAQSSILAEYEASFKKRGFTIQKPPREEEAE